MPGVDQLYGRRIPIVEDEGFIAREFATELLACGAEVVGPLARAKEAVSAINAIPIDGAIVDLRIHDEPIYEVVTSLRNQGIPFIFMSGFKDIPANFANIDLFAQQSVLHAVLAFLAAKMTDTPQ